MSTSKSRVLIVHGSFGGHDENWFPWLAEQVRLLGHEALVPAFPTPESQTLDNWRAAFESQVGSLTEGSVLVGHSLGAGFILALLEGSDVSVLGTFLVSGFIGRLGLDEFDTVNDSFVCRPFQW